MTVGTPTPSDDVINHAALIVSRLSHIALDVHVAFTNTDDSTVRPRLRRALLRIDETIKDMRMVAIGQDLGGEEGTGRRRG